MRTCHATIAVLLLAIACGVARAGPDARSAEAPALAADLAFKASRAWAYDLPAETFRPVAGAFDFRAAGGPRFAVALEGSALAVDTDADGETDVQVRGESGFVLLRADGEKPFRYAVRLRGGRGGWRYATGCVRRTEIAGTRITLIDQDGDGRYDGYGRDAMIVGHGKNACFLSRAVHLGGRLHGLEVAKDGATVRAAAWAGASGTLDLASTWDAQARLQAAVVRSEDGRFSFDLAEAERGLPVPTGRYLLHSGKLALGQSVVRFTRGRAEPFVVGADGRAQVAAGGPLAAEFAIARRGDEIVFDPSTVHYFGRAGEEYTVWKPFGKSPEFTVTDSKKGTEIAKAIFTGC